MELTVWQQLAVTNYFPLCRQTHGFYLYTDPVQSTNSTYFWCSQPISRLVAGLPSNKILWLMWCMCVVTGDWTRAWCSLPVARCLGLSDWNSSEQWTTARCPVPSRCHNFLSDLLLQGSAESWKARAASHLALTGGVREKVPECGSLWYLCVEALVSDINVNLPPGLLDWEHCLIRTLHLTLLQTPRLTLSTLSTEQTSYFVKYLFFANYKLSVILYFKRPLLGGWESDTGRLTDSVLINTSW